MQYLLHDLIRLPLQERLRIIEMAISSLGEDRMEGQLRDSLTGQANRLENHKTDAGRSLRIDKC